MELSASQVVTIYAICDPHTGEPRYIGQTVNALEHRLAQHHVRAGSALAAWLEQLDMPPTIHALATTDTLSANTVEKQHIAAYLAQGADLLNVTYTPRAGQHRRVAERKPKPPQFNLTINDEETRLLEALQNRLNLSNKSGVVRLALRRMADAEGVR